MLGIAALPALLQFILMFLLPESPRWLYRQVRFFHFQSHKNYTFIQVTYSSRSFTTFRMIDVFNWQGREEEAKATLRKIFPADEAESEIQALKELVETEIQEKWSSEKINITKLLKTKTVRRGLIAGVGLQVFQQFVGINTVMYYSATIVQLAGFASNQTALLLSLVIAALNACGSVVSIYFIDRTGRRKLLLISLCGVIISLCLLCAVFQESTSHSPLVSINETSHFNNSTCPDYGAVTRTSRTWDCMRCLKASSSGCGFCASATNKVLL